MFLINVCMYFTGEFSDIKSLEALKVFVLSAAAPRKVVASRTGVSMFFERTKDFAVCQEYWAGCVSKERFGMF